MERFPVLTLMLRIGTKGAGLIGVAIGALLLLALWPTLGWSALLIAVPIGLLLAVVAMSYIELIKLITEMLLPQ